MRKQESQTMKLLKHFKALTTHPKNVKELKGLILQLAIQGKLTANWRKENPTVKLDNEKLVEISKETLNFLNKESDSINQLDVPSTWLKLKFKTLFEMQGGSQPPKAMFSTTEKDGYIRLYQIRDFGKRPVPVYVPEDSVSKRCTEDDVMIGRYGASIGKIFYGKNGAYNVALVRLIWSRELLEQNFVFQIFSSFYMQEFFQNCTRSAQAGFNKTDMGKLNIPIPPLEEQKEIVKVVETLFKEVEQLEQLTAERIGLKEDFVTSTLNQLTTNKAKQEWTFLQDHFKSFFNETTNINKLRETVLQLAVQGKLTRAFRESHPELVSGSHHASQLLKHIQEEKAQLIKDKKIKKEKALPPITKEEIPYELPEGWVWCKLQDVVNVGTGSTPATSNTSYYDGTIPWYTSSATNDLFAKESEKLITEKALKETNCKVFPKETLLIAMYGQGKTRGQISELVIPGATNQAVAAMVFYKTSKEFKEYIKYFFRKIYDEIRLLAEGGAQPNLNVGKIKNTILPLPPLEEQKVIVQKVNILMGLCDALEQEVQQSQEHSEMLMQSCLREVFEVERKTVENEV